MMDITSEKRYTISDVREEDYFLLLSSLNVLQQQWEQVNPSLPTVGYDRLVKFLEQLRQHDKGLKNETRTNS
jgi:hypothetical protein